jgi:hypothetical protein
MIRSVGYVVGWGSTDGMDAVFGLSVISVQKVPLRKFNEISSLTVGRQDYTIDSKGISAF